MESQKGHEVTTGLGNAIGSSSILDNTNFR